MLATTSSKWIELTSSFWGAFFAFCFGLITYWLTKKRERYIHHTRTLIQIERLLYRHLQDFGALEEILNGGISSLKQQHVPVSLPFKLTFPEKIEEELGSLELLNMFFLYRMTIEKFNFNIETSNHAVSNIEDLSIHGQHVAVQNFAFAEKMQKKLLEDLPRVNTQTKNLLIRIRIHISRTAGTLPLVEGALHSQWEQDISEKDVVVEMQKWENEMQ